MKKIVYTVAALGELWGMIDSNVESATAKSIAFEQIKSDRAATNVNADQDTTATIMSIFSLTDLQQEPNKFMEVSDSVSSFLYKHSGWAYFGEKHFTNSKKVAALSLKKHAQVFQQSFFFTDGNENTFTKQMNETAKKIK